MDFLTLAAERYSVRSFLPEHLSQDVIDTILKAGQLAPTGCNYQPFRILVLNSDTAMEQLKNCTKCHFNAPTALLICCHAAEGWTRKYDGALSAPIDATIVTTHMMLQAHAIGIGCCWVMHFDPFAMRETYHIPEELEPIALLVMGHPAPDAAPLALHSQFRPLEDLVVYDSF